jgi:beta-aspartyl-peptidase (threonine type)
MIVRSISLFILFLIALSCTKTIPETPKAVLVIHGGAGWISRESVSDSMENAYITTLETALIKGRDVIKNGGSSLDAVQRAIEHLRRLSAI